MWWPLKGPDDILKILALWFNSTLGLISLLPIRQETEGAWVQFKKQTLPRLPVLNVPSLPEHKKRILLDAFEELKEEPLLPFPEMADDPTRAKIDEAFQKALGLPDLAPLREALAKEPIVSLQSLTRF